MKEMIYKLLGIIGMIWLMIACATDNTDYAKVTDEVTLFLSFQEQQPVTRVIVEQNENSLDLRTLWSEGDKVDLFVIYGGKVEHIGTIPVRNISDDRKGCTVSYRKPTIVDNDDAEYTLVGFVGTKTAFTDTEIYYDGSLHREPLHGFKVPAMFCINTTYNQSYAVFKPYGVYEVLHIKNLTKTKISFVLSGFTGGSAWAKMKGALTFSSGAFITGSEAETEPVTQCSIGIQPEETGNIISWYIPIPNYNKIQDAQMIAQINNNTVYSSNTLTSDRPLLEGHAYHMYATWNGKELRFGRDEESSLPLITMLQPQGTMTYDELFGKEGNSTVLFEWQPLTLDCSISYTLEMIADTPDGQQRTVVASGIEGATCEHNLSSTAGLKDALRVSYCVKAYDQSQPDKLVASSGDILLFENLSTPVPNFVDLGLPSGTLWATQNLGAKNNMDFGNYYAWGITSGYNEGKSCFAWKYYDLCKGANNKLTRYCTKSVYGNNGFTDDITQLKGSDDAVSRLWGYQYAIPTKSDWEELMTSCSWSRYGDNAVQVTGPNGNSIVLPAAGYRSNYDLLYAGSEGYYWSSTLDAESPDDAWMMHVSFIDARPSLYSYYRCQGRSIRPVKHIE